MFDFVKMVLWAVMGEVISVAVTILGWLAGLLVWGWTGDSVVWLALYDNSIHEYVFKSAALLNLFVDIDLIAAGVAATAVNVVVCFGVRLVFWVYHQIHGST